MPHPLKLSTCFIVDIKDKDGCDTGRSTPVTIDYSVEIDKSYGSDADGKNGVSSVSYEIIDVHIDNDSALLEEEKKQVIDDAKQIFLDWQL